MRIRTRGLLAALLLPALAIAGTGLAAAPAYAASPGPGYDYHGDPASHLGGFRDPDGTVSYCVDAAKPSPAGRETTDAGVVEHVNGRSDATMLQLSYVLMKYGNTSSDDQAAAVALVVWGLADGAEHAARGGDDFVITRAPADRRAHILALAARYRSEAADYRPPQDGEAQLSLEMPPDDRRNAVLTITLSPATATGDITLTNGRFAATKSATAEGVTDGEKLAVIAMQPTNVLQFDLTATGDFEARGYADGSVHLYTTPGAQSIASSGQRGPVQFAGTASVHIEFPPPPPPPVVPPETPNPTPLPRVAG